MAETILVTGGSGLVGNAIQKVLKEGEQRPGETWVFLSSKDGDLRKYEDVAKIFEQHKPTQVIHLAARVGGLFANMSDQLGFFEDNLAMNDAIIKLCHQYQVKSAIFCLSTCVFPAKVELPIREESIHEGFPHPSNEGYAFAKRMLDCHTRYYREKHGHKWMCVIPTNIYGPHDNFHLQNAHVIPALMHKCLLAKKNGTDFTVAGTGTPLRQFIYSEDLAKIMIFLLRNSETCPYSTVIACGDEGDEVSIGEVATSIVKNIGFEGNVVYDTSKSDGIHRKTATNEKLRKLLPADFKFSKMDDGMKVSAQWFMDNFETCRK